MTYGILWGLAVALAILSAGLAVVMAADPMSFGLTPITRNWLGVVSAMVGVAASFLPRVTKPPSDERKGMD